ncbi:MAG: hypothetical protein E7514_05060 [Ruminococcaceae bacterium]|nr:hypothetical protein [Oscillospiraceae bacterium]
MEKFTSYEKLSKKKQKELNSKKRAGWGKKSPVTKVKPSKKIYSRKKTRNRDDDDFGGAFFITLQRHIFRQNRNIIVKRKDCNY